MCQMWFSNYGPFGTVSIFIINEKLFGTLHSFSAQLKIDQIVKSKVVHTEMICSTLTPLLFTY